MDYQVISIVVVTNNNTQYVYYQHVLRRRQNFPSRGLPQRVTCMLCVAQFLHLMPFLTQPTEYNPWMLHPP